MLSTDIEEIARITGIPIERIYQSIEALNSSVSEITSTLQAKQLYNEAPVDSKLESMILDKWNALSLKEIESAVTLNELFKAFNNTPAKSIAESVAMLKCVEVASTKDELLEVLKITPKNSNIEAEVIAKIAVSLLQ